MSVLGVLALWGWLTICLSLTLGLVIFLLRQNMELVARIKRIGDALASQQA